MLNEESILIADTDPTFMQSLACYLMENGFQPTLMADVETAVAEVANGTFEIAVIEFCESLRCNGLKTALSQRSGETDIILTCRSHSIKAERAARELSPRFYFVKPVEVSDIFAVVLRIIEMKSKRKMAALRRMEQRERVRHG